jgi:hypothetical protein
VFKSIKVLSACVALLVFGVQARAQAPNSSNEGLQGKAPTFKEVSAVLTKYCGQCHGGGKGKPKANVDVSTYEKLMKSPSGIGKAVVPKDLKKSGLQASIDAGEMPPEGKPKPTEKELAIIRDWILAGAKPRRRSFVRRRLAAG